LALGPCAYRGNLVYCLETGQIAKFFQQRTGLLIDHGLAGIDEIEVEAHAALIADLGVLPDSAFLRALLRDQTDELARCSAPERRRCWRCCVWSPPLRAP
jgi:hypothetical protein